MKMNDGYMVDVCKDIEHSTYFQWKYLGIRGKIGFKHVIPLSFSGLITLLNKYQLHNQIERVVMQTGR